MAPATVTGMKRPVVLTTAICLCAAFSAHAHHSYGMFFDLCTIVTIEGTIDKVDWKDPHIWIDLETDNGVAYRGEWTSPRNLARDGVTSDRLKPGDRVAIAGSPPKDPAFGSTAGVKVVSALTQIRRASDGWSWSRGRATPGECVGR
jgi:hypothetical protein